ncbi:MAG: transcriptional activator Mta [Anaerolineae bacterium]
MYTVKQLSDLAGVTIRTLHYYDEIDLLRPSAVGKNGYRYYGEEALFRLQQILFFRELGLGLLQIKQIIDSPGFDLVTALRSHRRALQEQIDRLQGLISTIDSTIMHLVGEVEMSKKSIFAGFSEEKQKQYEQEAAEMYGQEIVGQSVWRWNSCSAEEKEQIKAEGGAIYTELAQHMNEGPQSPKVQAILARWHQHIRRFYEPTPEILRGLGIHYDEHPDFNATFTAIHPDLPAFLKEAITYYVDTLEANQPGSPD